jgi:alpha-ketoglutarate-dependent 2,4-dichlorophenoxyacetate dioxygenase
MTVTIRQVGPCFAGAVEGIDMRKPLSRDEVAAIHAGMDAYAVLVFHDQKIDDEEQLAFTRSLGEIEHAIGASLRMASDQRLPTTFADVSNLDKNNTPFARDDRRRLFAIGNRGSGEVLAVARNQHSVEGRQHAIRRHAGGLRCPG